MSEQYSTEEYPHLVNGDPVSKLQIMQSGAGYYIGRTYFDTEFGFEGPYSRETNYMTANDAREMHIDIISGLDWPRRDCIENGEVDKLDDLTISAGQPAVASYGEIMQAVGECLFAQNMRTHHLESEVLAHAIRTLAPEASKADVEAALASGMCEWDL